MTSDPMLPPDLPPPYLSIVTELKTHYADLRALRAASALFYWDQAVYMPSSGAPLRGEHQGRLDRLAHELATAPKVGRQLEDLRPLEESLDPDSDLAAFIRVAREDFLRDVRVPATFWEKYASHSTQAYMNWQKAREERNFSLVADDLKRTLDLSREYSSFFPGTGHIADPLIEPSDPGFTVATLRPLFARLRKELVPLFQQIARSQPFDNSCLLQSFPESQQLAFSDEMVARIGYDFNRGRQDKTAHPFAIRLNSHDVRITTRVKEHDFSDCLFSSLHEAGHAFYELGVDPHLENTPLGHGVSSGVHESQSRLWENLVARSRAFWSHFFPLAQERFPTQLKNVTLDEFHRAINRAEASLIRTDADEVTYNLHVMIRFDLECALLEGTLRVEDLPQAWDERYQTDLGVAARHPAEGVLQDVHWFHGFVGGAFQGYTIGNILSAQFYKAALAAHPEIPNEIAVGRFETLQNWLRHNVHRPGRKFTPPELIRRSTGQDLSIEPYMSYLREKYTGLLTPS